MDQSDLLKNVVKFDNKNRSRIKEGKDKKINIYESVYTLYQGRYLLMLSKAYFQ